MYVKCVHNMTILAKAYHHDEIISEDSLTKTQYDVKVNTVCITNVLLVT